MPETPRPRPPIAPFTPAAGAPVHLMPGQWHVGRDGSLKTLLGSCVGITIWSPQRKLGGMCHYLLPKRARRGTEPLDGRYGDEALELMVLALKKLGCPPEGCTAHLYGGADTLPDGMAKNFNVGERNIDQAWTMLERYGLNLDGVDVGDHVPRTVTLSLLTGDVTMTRGKSINRP